MERSMRESLAALVPKASLRGGCVPIDLLRAPAGVPGMGDARAVAGQREIVILQAVGLDLALVPAVARVQRRALGVQLLQVVNQFVEQDGAVEQVRFRM